MTDNSERSQAPVPSNPSPDPKPSDDRNGCFLDRMWCCKVCDGEIPDGHTENCDIWKLEKKHREFIAKEYNSVLTERDRLRAALEELRDETEAVMHGEHGADWADHFTPLFNLIQRAKALSGEPGSAHETKPEPDVGALNRQLCEAEGHVFSRFAMHHCLRCEAAVTPGGYLAYTSSQKAPETTAGVPVHYGSDGKLHLGEGPDGRRPPEKATGESR